MQRIILTFIVAIIASLSINTVINAQSNPPQIGEAIDALVKEARINVQRCTNYDCSEYEQRTEWTVSIQSTVTDELLVQLGTAREDGIYFFEFHQDHPFWRPVTITVHVPNEIGSEICKYIQTGYLLPLVPEVQYVYVPQKHCKLYLPMIVKVF